RMVTENIIQRSNGDCELCAAAAADQFFTVGPEVPGEERDIHICKVCRDQIEGKETADPKHWQCLSRSMWSETPAIQVVSWRMLHRFKEESWASDNLDMLYLDESLLGWAQAGGETAQAPEIHRDS